MVNLHSKFEFVLNDSFIPLAPQCEDPWEWNEARRQRWAEDLFSQQAYRRLERKRFVERLNLTKCVAIVLNFVLLQHCFFVRFFSDLFGSMV